MRLTTTVTEKTSAIPPSAFGMTKGITTTGGLYFDEKSFNLFVRNKVYDKILKETARELAELLKEFTKELPCCTGLLQLSGRIYCERREVAKVVTHGRGFSMPIFGWEEIEEGNRKRNVRRGYVYEYNPENVEVAMTNDATSPKFWMDVEQNLWKRKRVGFTIFYRRLGGDSPDSLPGEEDVDVAYLYLVEYGFWEMYFPQHIFDRIVQRSVAIAEAELKESCARKVKRDSTFRFTAEIRQPKVDSSILEELGEGLVIDPFSVT